ncbi:carboxymuconolactone decarboxylase family protein [Salana multivorans]
MAAGFGYTAKLSIGDRLAALLRLRVAQINPCSYCLILHTRIAVEVGIGAAMVAHLAELAAEHDVLRFRSTRTGVLRSADTLRARALR